MLGDLSDMLLVVLRVVLRHVHRDAHQILNRCPFSVTALGRLCSRNVSEPCFSAYCCILLIGQYACSSINTRASTLIVPSSPSVRALPRLNRHPQPSHHPERRAVHLFDGPRGLDDGKVVPAEQLSHQSRQNITRSHTILHQLSNQKLTSGSALLICINATLLPMHRNRPYPNSASRHDDMSASWPGSASGDAASIHRSGRNTSASSPQCCLERRIPH